MSDLTLETRPCPQNWVPLPMAGERMDEPGNPFLDRMPVPLIMESMCLFFCTLRLTTNPFRFFLASSF